MSCHCYDCVPGREARYSLRHGGEDWETDYDELVPYHKPASTPWGGKRKRPCKRSKTKEVCDFSVKKVYRSYNGWKTGEVHTDYVMTCSRCGKHGDILWSRSLF